jgi:hypothetical protein
MRPMEGCEGILELDNYQRGRALIERMASTVRGDGRPRLKLTSTDCADVLAFMHFSEPVNSRTWWFDPKGQPSHLVGYYLVVQTVEAALRKAVLP